MIKDSQFAKGLTKTYHDDIGVVLEFIDEPPEYELPEPPDWLAQTIGELVQNSPRVRNVFKTISAMENADLVKIRAKAAELAAQEKANGTIVRVYCTRNYVRVEDDYEQPDVAAALAKIREAQVATSHFSGSGIYLAQKHLGLKNGTLEYLPNGNRIIAKASWTN